MSQEYAATAGDQSLRRVVGQYIDRADRCTGSHDLALRIDRAIDGAAVIIHPHINGRSGAGKFLAPWNAHTHAVCKPDVQILCLVSAYSWQSASHGVRLFSASRCIFKYNAKRVSGLASLPPATGKIVPKVTFVNPDGSEQVVQAAVDQSLMEAAINGGVNRIVGECGGACQCATCHVYIGEPWRALLPAIGPDEDAMLDNTVAERRPESRLSCGIKVKPEYEGLVVQLPDRQI